MKSPRFLHRIYAWLNCYFWLPCDLCDEYFGGHEWTDRHVSISANDFGISTGVCTKCADRIRAKHPLYSEIKVHPVSHEERVIGRIYTLDDMKKSGNLPMEGRVKIVK